MLITFTVFEFTAFDINTVSFLRGPSLQMLVREGCLCWWLT